MQSVHRPPACTTLLKIHFINPTLLKMHFINPTRLANVHFFAVNE